jgi:hypothetical protein
MFAFQLSWATALVPGVSEYKDGKKAVAEYKKGNFWAGTMYVASVLVTGTLDVMTIVSLGSLSEVTMAGKAGAEVALKAGEEYAGKEFVEKELADNGLKSAAKSVSGETLNKAEKEELAYAHEQMQHIVKSYVKDNPGSIMSHDVKKIVKVAAKQNVTKDGQFAFTTIKGTGAKAKFVEGDWVNVPYKAEVYGGKKFTAIGAPKLSPGYVSHAIEEKFGQGAAYFEKKAAESTALTKYGYKAAYAVCKTPQMIVGGMRSGDMFRTLNGGAKPGVTYFGARATHVAGDYVAGKLETKRNVAGRRSRPMRQIVDPNETQQQEKPAEQQRQEFNQQPQRKPAEQQKQAVTDTTDLEKKKSYQKMLDNM